MAKKTQPTERGDTDRSTAPGGKEPHKTAKRDHTPGDLTKDDDQTTSNVSEEDLADAANAGAESKRGKGQGKKVKPLKEGEHLPGEDFRARVENTAAGDLNMDPRTPYPTGSPPDPRETFHRIHGRYPDDDDDYGPKGRAPKSTKKAQMDANPKT